MQAWIKRVEHYESPRRERMLAFYHKEIADLKELPYLDAATARLLTLPINYIVMEEISERLGLCIADGQLDRTDCNRYLKQLELLEPEFGTEEELLPVARNRNVDASYLSLLVLSSHISVRTAVAGNPALNEDDLCFLRHDPHLKVRQALANNPKTPPIALITLAGDWNVEIRRAVAAQPRMPQEVLTVLAQDDDPLVREAVRKNPNRVIKNPLRHVTQYNWRAFKIDSDQATFESAAADPRTPADVLFAMAHIADWMTSISLQKNPNVPKSAEAILVINKKVGYPCVKEENKKLMRNLTRGANFHRGALSYFPKFDLKNHSVSPDEPQFIDNWDDPNISPVIAKLSLRARELQEKTSKRKELTKSYRDEGSARTMAQLYKERPYLLLESM